MARTPVSNQTRPVTAGQTETRQPPLFKVLMHNDDYTTMEFVVEVLQSVFRKGPTEADSIMLHVHFGGGVDELDEVLRPPLDDVLAAEFFDLVHETILPDRTGN